ncbi:DUF6503 family protein [Allomuricauda sp. SCSIO 65647]|uniref:DUF6503 family protein n=1 Tax=Allomuricauda sp. SCSIO 65647 TaxID=2908843 RepID=UPI001F2130C1|nr:DUF6503 family protein [Muricauda sp. SCSIO 65647]UJH68862.1 DUF6503 family protein [Muricauda sp. SCSIO 65647]
MRIFLFISMALVLNPIFAQNLTGPELLEKAIEYHDPEGYWPTFQADFQVVMKTPNSSDRTSVISLDVPKGRFSLDVKKDDVFYRYELQGGDCTITLNGNVEISEENRKEHHLNCERAQLYKNYYTYLYGLPMKLKDPGTIVHQNVERKRFKDKEYLALKVEYDQEVGDDVWYFYFDPTTYAMEVYQFFHDESKNDGEYILLENVQEINGIKMPKVRAWYYNKDDTYLGTDILTALEP